MARRSRLEERRTRHCGLSREALAEKVGVTRSTISRWENGQSNPYDRQRRRLAEALEVPLEDLDWWLARDRQPGILDAAFNAGPAPWEGLSGSSRARARTADDQYVTSVREGTQAMVALDSQYGSDDLVPVVVRAFRAAHGRLVSGRYESNVERDLQAAVGEAGELAAWVAYDANQQTVARQLNHEALLVSRLAGDSDMELFGLANLAMQSVHLRRPVEASRIAEQVLTSRISGRTAALFHVRRARALAQLGERQRSLDALRQARALLADGISSRDPEWTWWVDDAELAWHEAMCLADIDDWPRAVDLFRQAYELRPAGKAPRGRYNDLAHLLEAQTIVQAWHEAEDTMTDVASCIGDVGSARTTVVLLRSVDRITQAAAPSSLTDQAEELRLLLAS